MSCLEFSSQNVINTFFIRGPSVIAWLIFYPKRSSFTHRVHLNFGFWNPISFSEEQSPINLIPGTEREKTDAEDFSSFSELNATDQKEWSASFLPKILQIPSLLLISWPAATNCVIAKLKLNLANHATAASRDAGRQRVHTRTRSGYGEKTLTRTMHSTRLFRRKKENTIQRMHKTPTHQLTQEEEDDEHSAAREME